MKTVRDAGILFACFSFGALCLAILVLAIHEDIRLSTSHLAADNAVAGTQRSLGIFLESIGKSVNGVTNAVRTCNPAIDPATPGCALFYAATKLGDGATGIDKSLRHATEGYYTVSPFGRVQHRPGLLYYASSISDSVAGIEQSFGSATQSFNRAGDKMADIEEQWRIAFPEIHSRFLATTGELNKTLDATRKTMNHVEEATPGFMESYRRLADNGGSLAGSADLIAQKFVARKSVPGYIWEAGKLAVYGISRTF